MRTMLFMVATLMIPMGVWFSGCRQDAAQAPMPKGPEMERLARSPGTSVEDAKALPPNVSTLIDPEILSVPDQPTFARIRAVMDREAVIMNRNAEPGLFVLPRQDYPEVAIVSDYHAPARTQGMESFWSRPVDASQYPVPNASPVPADVYAMAPPASPDIPGMYFGPDEPLPMPVPVESLSQPRYEPLPMPVPVESLSQPRYEPLPMPVPVESLSQPRYEPLPMPVPVESLSQPRYEPLPMPIPVTISARPPAASQADLFGKNELGLLASLTALDDLAGVMAVNAHKAGLIAKNAAGDAPSPESLPSLRPDAMGLAAGNDVLLPLPELAEPAGGPEKTLAAVPAEDAASVLDIGSLIEDMRRSTPEPASAGSVAPSLDALAFGDVVEPDFPSADQFRPEENQAGGKNELSFAGGEREEIGMPAAGDKGSPFHSLDPLLNYDFSAFDKKERENRLAVAPVPAASKPKPALDPTEEPAAPPLAD